MGSLWTINWCQHTCLDPWLLVLSSGSSLIVSVSGLIREQVAAFLIPSSSMPSNGYRKWKKVSQVLSTRWGQLCTWRHLWNIVVCLLTFYLICRKEHYSWPVVSAHKSDVCDTRFVCLSCFVSRSQIRNRNGYVVKLFSVLAITVFKFGKPFTIWGHKTVTCTHLIIMMHIDGNGKLVCHCLQSHGKSNYCSF